MTEQDKEVSRREMRKCLYFAGLIASIDASNQECAAALRMIPKIDRVDVLWPMVRGDGIWAARQVLKETA